jgi:hypothetical protein
MKRYFKNIHTENDSVISVPEHEIEIIYNMYGYYTKNEDGELEEISSSGGYWFDEDGRGINDNIFNHGDMIDRGKPKPLFDEDGNEIEKIDSGHYMEVYIYHKNGWKAHVLSDSAEQETEWKEVTWEDVDINTDLDLSESQIESIKKEALEMGILSVYTDEESNDDEGIGIYYDISNPWETTKEFAFNIDKL